MRQPSLSSKALDSSGQVTHKFEYGTLDNNTRVLVMQHTNDIKALMRRTCEDIINIGLKLIEVKDFLGHGKFVSWLESEFNWSVSIATKFMQVGKQFKNVNFTNLNITASALYLIAAPSTPHEVRAEVLKRASLGESISYTETKQIIQQYKKNSQYQVEKPAIFDTSIPIPIEIENKTQKSQMLHVVSTAKNLNQEENTVILPSSICYKAKKTDINKSDDSTQDQTQLVNMVTTPDEAPNTVISEIVVNINKLTPEELALVISESANTGLTNQHLRAIIASSQQALNARQMQETT